MQDEEEEAVRRRQAERLAMLAELARPVQHDINNLLTVVFANLDLLKRRLTEEAPQRQLARVSEATRRLEVSTRAILSLTRRPVPGEAVLSLNAAVEALQPLLVVLLPAPGALHVEIVPETPACRFDRALLDKALLGLARATAGRGALRIGVAEQPAGVAVEVTLPEAAGAAAGEAMTALRTLAAAAGGRLDEAVAEGTIVLRLLLPPHREEAEGQGPAATSPP